MRKQYKQIIGYILMIPILLAVSGFCFQKFVSAAPLIDSVSVAASIEKSNDCDSAKQNLIVKEHLTKSHGSLALCCISNTHKVFPSIFRSNDTDQSVPLLAFVPATQSTFEIIPFIYYLAPVVSPPELSSIKSTILRI